MDRDSTKSLKLVSRDVRAIKVSSKLSYRTRCVSVLQACPPTSEQLRSRENYRILLASPFCLTKERRQISNKVCEIFSEICLEIRHAISSAFLLPDSKVSPLTKYRKPRNLTHELSHESAHKMHMACTRRYPRKCPRRLMLSV